MNTLLNSLPEFELIKKGSFSQSDVDALRTAIRSQDADVCALVEASAALFNLSVASADPTQLEKTALVANLSVDLIWEADLSLLPMRTRNAVCYSGSKVCSVNLDLAEDARATPDVSAAALQHSEKVFEWTVKSAKGLMIELADKPDKSMALDVQTTLCRLEICRARFAAARGDSESVIKIIKDRMSAMKNDKSEARRLVSLCRSVTHKFHQEKKYEEACEVMSLMFDIRVMAHIKNSSQMTEDCKLMVKLCIEVGKFSEAPTYIDSLVSLGKEKEALVCAMRVSIRMEEGEDSVMRLVEQLLQHELSYPEYLETFRVLMDDSEGFNNYAKTMVNCDGDEARRALCLRALLDCMIGSGRLDAALEVAMQATQLATCPVALIRTVWDQADKFFSEKDSQSVVVWLSAASALLESCPDIQDREAARLFRDLAQSLLDVSRVEEASVALEKAADLDSENAFLYYLKFQVSVKSGLDDVSASGLIQKLSTNPGLASGEKFKALQNCASWCIEEGKEELAQEVLISLCEWPISEVSTPDLINVIQVASQHVHQATALVKILERGFHILAKFPQSQRGKKPWFFARQSYNSALKLSKKCESLALYEICDQFGSLMTPCDVEKHGVVLLRLKCLSMAASDSLELCKAHLLEPSDAFKSARGSYDSLVKLLDDVEAAAANREMTELMCLVVLSVLELMMISDSAPSDVLEIVRSCTEKRRSGIELTAEMCMVIAQKCQKFGFFETEKMIRVEAVNKLMSNWPEDVENILTGFLASVIRILKLMEDDEAETAEELEAQWKLPLDCIQFLVTHRDMPCISTSIHANWDMVHWMITSVWNVGLAVREQFGSHQARAMCHVAHSLANIEGFPHKVALTRRMEPMLKTLDPDGLQGKSLINCD